jgi:hypothetical protein
MIEMPCSSNRKPRACEFPDGRAHPRLAVQQLIHRRVRLQNSRAAGCLFYGNGPMGDLKNPKLIWLKGVLFLLLGLMAAGLIVVQTWDFQVAVLLLIAIWAFCRCYYFAFYVIERYVDSEYRFAGLLDFLKYTLARWSSRSK